MQSQGCKRTRIEEEALGDDQKEFFVIEPPSKRFTPWQVDQELQVSHGGAGKGLCAHAGMHAFMCVYSCPLFGIRKVYSTRNITKSHASDPHLRMHVFVMANTSKQSQ
jgi:hypothetical protein